MSLKLRLTPEISYFLGFWCHSKTKEGIGVVGKERIERFVEISLKMSLTEPNKILIEGRKAYFYNSRLLKFLIRLEEKKHERFKYHNEYSGNYLAGLFDSVGTFKEGVALLRKWCRKDEIILSNLGFRFEKIRGNVLPMPNKYFLKFILPYSERAKHAVV